MLTLSFSAEDRATLLERIRTFIREEERELTPDQEPFAHREAREYVSALLERLSPDGAAREILHKWAEDALDEDREFTPFAEMVERFGQGENKNKSWAGKVQPLTKAANAMGREPVATYKKSLQGWVMKPEIAEAIVDVLGEEFPMNKIVKQFEKSIPDGADREEAMRFFGRMIDICHRHLPQEWGITTSDTFRVIAGGYRSGTLVPGGIWLPVSHSSRPELLEELGWVEDPKDPVYKDKAKEVLSRNGTISFPLGSPAAEERLLELYEEFIKDVAERGKSFRADSKSTHDEVGIDFLEKRIGRTLPRPDYGDE